MSQLRCFALIGDSNLRRHLSPTNTKGHPLKSSAKYLPCSRLSALSATLESIPLESDACVVACVTNFLTASAAASSITLRVEVILASFLEKLALCASHRPDLSIFACPPMYRTTPLWYRDGLPEIMLRFASCIKELPIKPPNLHIMPSFAKPQLEADGVHLNPYSGLEYINYLFDASQEIMDALALDSDSRISLLSESSRALEDRISVVEQDHARLSRTVEYQNAVTAEFIDFQENVRNEDFIMVQGLARLPKLDSKEWQIQAKESVNKVLSDMGLEYKTRYVQNSTGKGKDSKTLYKARLDSVAISREVRDKFSTYFAGGTDSRPPSLKNISVRNCVTPGTLARVAILQLLGRRYTKSNPGSKYQVVAYESRPILKITPAQGSSKASKARVMTFNFIEAISKLPTSFSKEEIEDLLKRVSPRLHGNLRPLLVVLSDDMVRKRAGSKAKQQDRQSIVDIDADDTSEPESSEFLTPESAPGAGARRKRGPTTPASGPSSKK